MDGHQRDLYLFERLNARVLGVSMDEVTTIRFFAKELWLEFPLVANTLAWMGASYGAYAEKPPFAPDGSPLRFGRRTVVIDRKGIVRYIKNGSPDNKEILEFLVQLEKEALKK